MLICEKCKGQNFYLSKENILTCSMCLYPVHGLRYLEHFRKVSKGWVKVYEQK